MKSAANAVVLESLRELIQTKAGYRYRNSLSFSRLEEGIPQGALTEISGSGKTEFLVHFLSEHPNLRVAWVENQFSICPHALFQRQAHLQRILFAEAGSNSHWTLMQVLRSQLFGIVVFSSTTIPLGKIGAGDEIGQEFFEEKALRAMQLSAEKSRAALIFLRDEPGDSWPISLQIRVEGTRAKILRRR